MLNENNRNFSDYDFNIGKSVIERFDKDVLLSFNQDLPTTYQKLIHQLHYARFISEENRRETWPETVLRFMNFIYEQCLDFNYKLTKDEFYDLYYGIVNLHVLPSMRLLWCAGNAVRQNPVSNYNCFKSDTKFITCSGVKSFDDFQDGDEITVLSHDGSWNNAIVRNYGKQKLNKINFIRGNSNDNIVYATKNHRWILEDDSQTTNLQIGDYVKASPNIFDNFDYDEAEPFERLYWCYGFIYGDGTLCKDKDENYVRSMLRLCGDKVKFAYRFTEMGFTSSFPLSCKGDLMFYTGKYLKTLPNLEIDSPNLIRSFIAGYLQADGYKNHDTGKITKYISIQATGEEAIDFIRKSFPIAGIIITSERDLTGQITNYGERKDKTVIFKISTNLNNKTNTKWKVRSIEETDLFEDVWCLEVENTHSFVLANGISTGNCAYIGIEDIEAFSEILLLGMSGTGVGFSVEHNYIKNLPVIKPYVAHLDKIYPIEDSREGWAIALKILIYNCYIGYKSKFNFDKIRPAGERLSTAGGFSSGSQCLKDLFNYIENLFSYASGRKLTSLECHDLVCKIAETAVAGGTRRCLPRGTKILTEKGYSYIEDLSVGEVVLSYDKGKLVKKKVLAKEKVGKRLLTIIKTKFGEIYSTKEHRWPIMVDTFQKTLSFKKTQHIEKGDYLIIYKNNNFINVPVIENSCLTGKIEECWDIQIEDTELFIADGFLSHNSALISFSDLNDKEMQKAKFGEWWKDNSQRALANNSAVYHEQPSFEEFNNEWENLIESKSGERGIFNQVAVLNKIKQLGKRDPSIIYRSNPCFAPETLIPTKQGIFPIKDLVGKTVEIWNGTQWESVNNFRVTGNDQPILRLSFCDGSIIRLTPYHTCLLEDGTKIEAKDLKVGMKLQKSYYPEISYNTISDTISNKRGYLKGILFSLGQVCSTSDKPYLRLPFHYNYLFPILEEQLRSIPVDDPNYPIKNIFEKTRFGEYILVGLGERSNTLKKWCSEYKENFNLEILSWNYTDRIDFLSGVFDAVGYGIDSFEELSYSLIFETVEMARNFQILLYSIKINSFIDNYRDGFRLYVLSDQAIKLSNKLYFNRLMSFNMRYMLPQFYFHENEISNIEEDGIEKEVYCCTVESNNSFATGNNILFGNCSEIQLQHRQFCNLSNVIIRAEDNKNSVVSKIRLATILGTIQSTLTNFKYLNPRWKKITEEERLLGVSLSGIFDNKLFFPNDKTHLPDLLSSLRYVAVNTNRVWAHKLHIPTSNAITTIKPSGDSSQLTDCSSGIHPRYAPYYLRRLRMNIVDPIAQQLIDRKVPFEISTTNNNVLIFSFPQKSPEHVTTFGHNLSAIEHTKLWLQYAKYWSEHMVSCTVMVHSEKEWRDLANFVHNNFEEICGLSFLPYDDHIYEQAPYEKIDENTYKKELEKIPHVDFTEFKEYNDITSAPIACEGAFCELLNNNDQK